MPEPELVKVPVFVNPYDPALTTSDIQCMEPCDQTATGLVIQPEHYGWVAAGPPEWIQCSITFWNEYGKHGPFWIQDTGGELLKPQYVEKLGQTVQFIDILFHLADENGERLEDIQWPLWNHGIYKEYELTCPT
jgi:hypothetical protein